MRNARLWSVAFVVAMAGCAGSAEPFAASPQSVAPATIVPAVTITGTYDGTLKESLGSRSRSGSCVITLTQSGKSVKGNADVHFSSGPSYEFSVSGSVKSDSKKVAKLTLIFSDNTGSGKGNATIKGATIRGKGTYPGTAGTTYVITFTAKRT